MRRRKVEIPLCADSAATKAVEWFLFEKVGPVTKKYIFDLDGLLWHLNHLYEMWCFVSKGLKSIEVFHDSKSGL